MGLDLTISEQSEFRTDSKGRPQHTVTELLNIHGSEGHLFLDNVGGLSELSNCSTMTIDAMDIFEGLEIFRDMLAEQDTLTLKTKYEELLNQQNELILKLCEKYSISDKQLLTKYYLTDEEKEIVGRLTDEERDKLNTLHKDITYISSDLREVNELEDIIATIEQFNRDNNLKHDELTWGDRTFEVHIWY